MIPLFGTFSFLGVIVCVVLVIKNLKKKKPVKPVGIAALVCLVVFFVCLALDPASQSDTVEPTSPEKIAENSAEPEIVEQTPDAVVSDDSNTADSDIETEVETEEIEAADVETEENIAEKHARDFIVGAKMTLDKYITGYDMSLAEQRWTIAKFDETDTLIGMTDIKYNGVNGKYIFVGTLNFDGDKVISITPHYIEVNGESFADDGYCTEVFEKIQALTE